MGILKEIPELMEAGILTRETADKIKDYYQTKSGNPLKQIMVIFAVLGALLTGLGIILILAHNWDEIPRKIKTVLAFVPLLTGHILGVFTILKRENNLIWKESVASFIILAVGAGISLISQLYHISGDMGAFILVWMILCLPLVYLLRSFLAFYLVLTGITCYAVIEGYNNFHSHSPWYYWILLLTIIPFYIRHIKLNPESRLLTFIHWLIPVSVLLALGMFFNHYEHYMVFTYLGIFAIFSMVGNFPVINNLRPWQTGYKILGETGTLFVLFLLSFHEYWEDLERKHNDLQQFIRSSEVLSLCIVYILAIALIIYHYRRFSIRKLNPFHFVFLWFLIVFLIGINTSLPQVLINLTILGFGIWLIRVGSLKDHLGILNFGLLIITILIVCRFFDNDMTFVLRGILFIAVGISFFFANYFMLKKRRKNEI